MAWSDVQAAFDFKGECSADAISVLRVLAYKVWKKGYAYCGTEYIAQAIRRRSRKTVHSAINELIERGYVHRFSGRYGGVRNVYFINIPGALAVDNPVYKLALKQIEETGVCKLRPFGECNPRQIVCKPRSERCVKDAPEEGKIEINQDPSDPQESCEGTDYTPPPEPAPLPTPTETPKARQPTPPVDSPEFLELAVEVCKKAGATQAEALRFYKQNAAKNWEKIDHMTLEAAAKQYVAEWKVRDIRAWSTEQLNRFKKEHNL